MKKILMIVVIFLALVGVLSIVLYIVNHKVVRVQTKETSLSSQDIMTSLPRESIKSEGMVKFTYLTHGEFNSLALIEDQSLLGMTAGAFNPQFNPLSSSEQKTLKASEEQNPELQNMTAGDLNDQSGIGTATYATVIIVALLLILIF